MAERYRDFSVRLRFVLDFRKMSQAEFFRQMEVSKKTGEQWLGTGRMAEPDLITIRRICRLLEVSADYLLGLKNSMS